jgi:hypothetical protein
MSLKFCQGPECHIYDTKDRLRGPAGSKTYQTRRRSSFYYGGSNFCSLNCQNDWFEIYGNRAIDHFGRLTEPKHLTEQNAWVKRYDWRDNTLGSDNRYYYSVNKITKEERQLTEDQYRDSNYTLNER